MRKEVDWVDGFHFPPEGLPLHPVKPLPEPPVLIHDRLLPVRFFLQLIRVRVKTRDRVPGVTREGFPHFF